MRETDGFVDVDERKREKNVHNIDVSFETSDSKRSLKEVRISEEERKKDGLDVVLCCQTCR